MKNNIDIAQIIKEVKTGAFMRSCYIPMGYSAGLPIIRELNSTLCITIPYLKYVMTGEVDKTLVYPIRYAITMDIKNKTVVRYEDLAFNPAMAKVDFNKPVGFFRHDSIKGYNKSKYEEEKNKLFALYNKIIERKLNGMPCSSADEKNFKELLATLVEPSVKIIYKVIDKDFYDKYMA